MARPSFSFSFNTVLLAIFGFFLISVSAVPASPIAANAIGDIINTLKLGLVTQISVTITLDSLVTNLVSANFDVKNPLVVELAMDRVVTTAGVNGTVYASFDQTFSTPIVVPILGTANSGDFGNVLLNQGALASLDIIPLGVLDLIDADVYLRAATIDGKLGIPIAITGLKQSSVPTVYNLSVDE